MTIDPAAGWIRHSRMAIDPAAGCQKRNGYSPGSSILTLNTWLPDLKATWLYLMPGLDGGLRCLRDTHMLKHTGILPKILGLGPKHGSHFSLKKKKKSGGVLELFFDGEKYIFLGWIASAWFTAIDPAAGSIMRNGYWPGGRVNSLLPKKNHTKIIQANQVFFEGRTVRRNLNFYSKCFSLCPPAIWAMKITSWYGWSEYNQLNCTVQSYMQCLAVEFCTSLLSRFLLFYPTIATRIKQLT